MLCGLVYEGPVFVGLIFRGLIFRILWYITDREDHEVLRRLFIVWQKPVGDLAWH